MQVNNWMLHTLEEPFGFDLPAVDILRGRDYGLPTYNQFREACGLCRLQTFEELANDIINPEVYLITPPYTQTYAERNSNTIFTGH